jgi:hypothetical protein
MRVQTPGLCLLLAVLFVWCVLAPVTPQPAVTTP